MDYEVPDAELQFRAARSGGPGGQHVNKTSTMVMVTWNIASSPSLSPERRDRLLETLETRIDRRGAITVRSSKHRSQRRNRDAAVERLRLLVRDALHEPPKRKRTKPTRAARETRLADKKKRSETKQRRQAPPHSPDD